MDRTNAVGARLPVFQRQAAERAYRRVWANFETRELADVAISDLLWANVTVLEFWERLYEVSAARCRQWGIPPRPDLLTAEP